MTDPIRWLKWRRRSLYTLLTLTTTLLGSSTLYSVLRTDGLSITEWTTLLLFSLAFALISTSFWNAVIGFCIRLFSRQPLQWVLPHARIDCTATASRTAVVMPVFNEDPGACIARLEATMLSLQASGPTERFAFFLLSDTSDPDLASEEAHQWQALEQRNPTLAGRVHYRRRASNRGRKVGNIDDFCRRWGEQFDYMIILDADSTMSGSTVRRLQTLMDANAQVGIIQTTPLPIGQHTLFARILQFSGWLCGEMLATGLSYWQLDDGCYYGHNAIIRIAPFVRHCQLPILPGSGPLSGEILSHDFAEAAFMRAAGWAIWTLPDGRGSYEELPSNIIEFARRDRRWCQGNLQHLRLLAWPRLRWMSRIHLLLGALAYLASPLWLALIVLGGIQLLEQAYIEHNYFAGDSLFPRWQIDSSASAQLLFLVTLGLLLAPKMLAALLTTIKRTPLQQPLGKLTCSLLLESIFSALLAPILMVFHTLFVASILAGRTIRWNPRLQAIDTLGLFSAWRQLSAQFIVGIAIIVLIGSRFPDHLYWLMPVLTGLLLAAPLAVLGNSRALGTASRNCGLFLNPTEVLPPSHDHPLYSPQHPPKPAAIAEPA